MSERDEQSWQGAPRAGAPHAPADDWREQTTPGIPPIRGGAAAAPAPGGYGGGFPAGPAGSPVTTPPYSSRPVTLRRPEALGGMLLVLAGVAAGVSLLLRWLHGTDSTGLTILQTSLRHLTDQRSGFLTDGWWQPVVVVLGGGVLFLLGLLLLVPARAHRLLGLVALLVALVVTAGVLTPMAQDRWATDPFDLGWWFAAAVAGLGLLGALKALLTGPRSRRA
jgi:hypothetical protein